MRSGRNRMIGRFCGLVVVSLCLQGLATGGASLVEPGSIYHNGWIDLNKNGKMDPYENPKVEVEKRIADLLARMTTDERTGDVMREMLNADFKTVEFDPMRLAQPVTEAEKKIAPTRVRLGPDWLAFVSNWMAEWERTGDTRWRDKILAGVESLSKMPFGMRTGLNLVLGYDPATGRLFPLGNEAGQYNLATIMGGAEVAFELGLMLDDVRWHKLWQQYCRLYNAPKEVLIRDMTTGTEGMDASYARDGRLAAYVYFKTQNPAFRQVAVNSLVRPRMGGRGGTAARRVEGPESLNPVDESGMAGTNGAAQNGLETIAMLGMVGDDLPADMPPQTEGQGGRFNRGGRGAMGGKAPPSNETAIPGSQ